MKKKLKSGTERKEAGINELTVFLRENHNNPIIRIPEPNKRKISFIPARDNINTTLPMIPSSRLFNDFLARGRMAVKITDIMAGLIPYTSG